MTDRALSPCPWDRPGPRGQRPGARPAPQRLSGTRGGLAPRTPQDIWRAKKGAALALLLAATPAAADDDALWQAFERHCLVPYEHLVLPDLRGLTATAEGWTDGTFLVTTTPESCAVSGGTPGDLGARLAIRDLAYETVAPGRHHSDRWREPRLAVEATSDGYVARETDLES